MRDNACDCVYMHTMQWSSPKQPDSEKAPRGATEASADGVLTLSDSLFQGKLGTARRRERILRLQFN